MPQAVFEAMTPVPERPETGIGCWQDQNIIVS